MTTPKHKSSSMADLESVLGKLDHIARAQHLENYILDLRSLMRRFFRAAETEGEGPSLARYRTFVCLRLEEILHRATHLELLSDLFDYLFDLPPFGPLLVVRFFREDGHDAEHQATAIDLLHQRNKLLLAGLGLQCSDRLSDTFHRFVPGQLKYLKKRNNSLVASFLRFHFTHGVEMDPVVVNTLLQSRFLQHLQGKLEREWRLKDVRMFHFLRPLRMPFLVERLAPLFRTSSVDELLQLLELVQNTPGPFSGDFLAHVEENASHPRLEVVFASLAALLKHAPSRALPQMTSLYCDCPALRPHLAGLCLLLDLPRFSSFLQSIPVPGREQFFSLVLALVLHIDPEGMQKVLRSLRSRSLCQCATNLLQDITFARIHEIKDSFGSDGLHERTLSPGNQRKQRTPAHTETRDSFFFKTLDPKLPLTGGVFRECRFEEISFENSNFGHSTFKECRFYNCSFAGARFETMSFQGCLFHECDFGSASFGKVLLRNSDFTACDFSQAEFLHLEASELNFARSGFTYCRLAHSRITRSRFVAADFTGSLLHELHLEGLLFAHSVFTHACMQYLVMPCTNFELCSLHGVQVREIDSTNIYLMRLQQQRLYEEISSIEQTIERLTLPDQIPPDQAWTIVEEWFAYATLRKHLQSFSCWNQTRLNLAMEKLSAKQQQFLKILPLLLASNLSSQVQPGSSPNFHSTLSQYYPTPETQELANRFFPDHPIELHEQGPRIEALYTIGSTGSVAQTPTSDLDCWICADLQHWSELERNRCTSLLLDIGAWARSFFRMEVHFFLQDIRRIKNNDFEHVEGEGSGTAQGLLLKEEFYRTGLLLAGKPPAWWIAPEGCSGEEYAIWSGWAANFEIPCLDFGPLTKVPPGEFFGASLWQIVKSFTSPFKSVLKMGLLEKYVRRMKRPLLCENLKDHILAGYEHPLHTDPYILLFREVWNYYCMVVDKDVLKILRFAFTQKTDMPPEDFQTTFTMEPVLGLYCLEDLLSTRSDSLWGISSLEELEFKDLLEMETNLNRFMHRAYVRVQEGLVRKGRASIEAGDLNRLGRKIFTAFAPRQDKISRYPYQLVSRSSFEEFSFSSNTEHENSREWLVRGKQFDRKGSRFYLSEINRSTNLAAQLLWLVANGLFHPGMLIRTDFSVSPVTRDDMVDLLSRFHEYFPPDLVFETDLDEGLNPERVLKVLLVFDLTLPSASTWVHEVFLCYCTNWGELFCKTLAVPRLPYPPQARSFVLENLDKDLDPDCLIETFVPRRTASRHTPLLPGSGGKSH